MKVRTITADGDWTFGRGLQNYKTEESAMMQSIRTRLLSWKGNCFFAPNEGVDWNNYLDIGMKALLDLDIKRIILKTGGVLRLRDYSSTLDLEERSLAVTGRIATIFGDLNLNEVL